MLREQAIHQAVDVLIEPIQSILVVSTVEPVHITVID
jgi:hypothetical protein